MSVCFSRDKKNMAPLYSLLSVLAVSIGLCYARCPDEWISFGNSCYLFTTSTGTFAQAEAYCSHHQAHLVSVGTDPESLFLKSRCLELKDNARWIGLTDAQRESVWKWTDGSSFVHSDWHPGEPNAQHSANCVALWPHHHYEWADESCSRAYRSICEKPDTGCVEIVG